jgi:HAD superfamily hydrolase (TIGR01509 family)
MKSNGLDAEKVMRRSDDVLFEMFDRSVPAIPNVNAVLNDFALKKAICSNSSIERLQRSVGRTSLAAFFGKHIYSAEHVENAKPAPDLALYACRALGVAPHEAIFIDDNMHGIRCAKDAGCLAVGFIGPTDHRKDQDAVLRTAGADHVVYGMEEFYAFLESLPLEHPSSAICLSA